MISPEARWIVIDELGKLVDQLHSTGEREAADYISELRKKLQRP